MKLTKKKCAHFIVKKYGGDIMGKLLKKITTFLFMCVLMVSMLPGTILADQTESERNAIYVQVPDEWENPCVWAWNEDGTNAFEAWPGEEMEADPNNEGWYYLWVPRFANHVIINANEGTVQTEEQILDAGNAWITIAEDATATVSYEAQTEGEIPEYVEKFVVHAQVDASWSNPCIWAWSAPDGTNAFESWPGLQMTDDGDGWYSAKVPQWINSIIINGNEGSVQTSDLAIDPAEIWVTVGADGAADFSYVDPTKEAVPNVTVSVMVPSDWQGACLWAWSAPDGTNVYSTWPGEALAEGENGWLQKEIPGWVNSVIVNANEGSVQTTDISVETGKDIWLVVNGPEDFSLSYEEPDVSVTAETTEATVEDTETETEADTVETIAEETGGNNILPIIIVIAVIVIAVIVIVVVKKRK